MPRLSPGTLIVGVFAVLFGLLGAYAVKKWLSQPAPVQAAQEAPKPTPVPLAAFDLPAGRTIAQGDVITIPMTDEEVIKAKFPRITVDKVSQILGRTLHQPVKKGQPFEPSSFYPAGTGPDLADELQPGERAVTIPLSKDSFDPTFVTPGSIVDVLFRATPDEKQEVPDATVTLLSRVRILAVGQNTYPGLITKTAETGQQTQNVTVAVSQTQARALKVVEGRGTFLLALRNSKDERQAKEGGPTTLSGLLGMKEPSMPSVTEIYRRGQLSTTTFQDGHRRKMTFDPPFGLPVSADANNGKSNPSDVRFPGPWWGGGRGFGGYVPGFPGEGRGTVITPAAGYY